MILQFGIIADAQYANLEPRINRYYYNSLRKLREAVEVFNAANVDFVLNFGDLIDRNSESWQPALAELKRLRIPIYHLAGNHDFLVESQEQKSAIYQLLGMPQPHYSFVRNRWRFVLLDGNELSYHASHSPAQQQELEELWRCPEKLSNTNDWNGAVSRNQLEWLQSTLVSAQEAGERVLVCCHFPVLLAHSSACLWNAQEVRMVLSSHSSIAAYLSGHHHDGDYQFADGIHYLTFKGMVETEKENAFAIVSLSDERITVEGYGRESRRELLLAM